MLTVSKGVLGAMLALATALATQAAAQPTLNRTVAPNDNVRPAGVVSQGVLKVRLVAGRRLGFAQLGQERHRRMAEVIKVTPRVAQHGCA